MQAITFTLELLEPLLTTGLEGDPNSGVSLNYVPGSVLRGALIARYLNKKPGNPSPLNLDPVDPTERALFFDGTVRYLNAYPLAVASDHETEPIRPVPLSWYIEKDKEPKTYVFDLCWQSTQKAFGDNKPNKPLPRPFFYFHEGNIVTVTPKRRLAVHTQRDRRKGRATEEEGAVYRYESIVSGERFGGVILFADNAEQELIDQIKELLTDAQLRLGGSRTAGYGRARVADIVYDPQNKDWYEFLIRETISKGRQFTLTLLSNALIRDQYGQYQADLTAEEVTSRLGKEVTSVGDRTFKRAEVIGGFNRKWGLPLPQVVSLKAGSVFSFNAESEISPADFKRLIDDGIGDRRAEGFGRVAINLNTSQRLDWLPSEDRERIEPVEIKSNTSKKVAGHMLERILRQRLDQQLVEMAGRYEIKNAPPNSQIARLRAVVREAMLVGNEQPITDFFKSIKSIAGRHFARAQVFDGPNRVGSLEDWVKDRLNKLDQFTPELPLLGKDDLLKADYNKALKLEYHLRLIDGVLVRAAKENNQREAAGGR